MRVAVVGAGLSGLTAAALLARRGHDVVLFEATGRLGGLAAPIELGPHRFCPGPQYLWGMADDGEGRAILNAIGVTTPMRAIDAGFERVVIGEGDDAFVTTIERGNPQSGLSDGGVLMAQALDRLGRCGVVIAQGAGFRRGGAVMLRQVAVSSLSLSDKATLLSLRDDSVLDLAKRCGATARDVRLLVCQQPIFAESLADLSAVLFAACRHLMRQVHVPHGGVVQLLDDLAAAVRGLDVRLRAPVQRLSRGGEAWDVDTATTRERFDHVVWCASPAILQRLVPFDAPGYAPSPSVHCVCLDVSLSDHALAAVRDRSLLWFASDDDVPFAAPSDQAPPLRALNLLAPTLSRTPPDATPPDRHALCAYAQSGTHPDDVIARVRALLPGDLEVHGVRSLDGAAWEHFGPGGQAVYGRRKTARGLQHSVVDALPRPLRGRLSMAHAGAGIPGVLGCLQMAQAVVEELAP